MTTAIFPRGVSQMNQEPILSRSLADFRRYLLDGEHWRAGKAVHGEVSDFKGFALHRSTPGTDGQEGPRQFTGAFLEHLEQSRANDRVAENWRNAKARHARIDEAIRVVSEDRPNEIAALRFYVVPLGRRPSSVQLQAIKADVTPETYLTWARYACELVLDELGGIW